MIDFLALLASGFRPGTARDLREIGWATLSVITAAFDYGSGPILYVHISVPGVWTMPGSTEAAA